MASIKVKELSGFKLALLLRSDLLLLAGDKFHKVATPNESSVHFIALKLGQKCKYCDSKRGILQL